MSAPAPYANDEVPDMVYAQLVYAMQNEGDVFLGISTSGNSKNCVYAAVTAKALGLENVTAVSARAEEMGKDVKYRESFDVATARAVAALPILSELCLPFVKKNGCFVAMKASKGSEELELSAKAIELCGGKTETVKEFDLTSESEIERRIIISVRKKQNTPLKYPRHYSQITKKPL